MKSIYSNLTLYIFGVFFITIPSLVSAAPYTSGCTSALGTPTGFRSMFSTACVSTYDEWIKLVWRWALLAVLPLSTLILTVAGVIYMTSGGNPDRVGLAKKLFFGVLSGVGLLILARALLYAIGVGNLWNV